MSVGYGDRPLTTAFCGFLQAFNKRNPKMIRFTMEDLYARIEERLIAAYIWHSKLLNDFAVLFTVTCDCVC